MIATTRATVWAVAALLLAAVATACGTSAPTTPPTAGASTAPAEVTAAVGADGLSARSVVDALAQVHPAPTRGTTPATA